MSYTYNQDVNQIKLKRFANIGNALLIKALGVQANYKENTVVLNEKNTGCYSCKNYIMLHAANNDSTVDAEKIKNTCLSKCESCNKKVYCQRIVYHNERNKYGYLPRLKTNAIKLLLAYHMIGLNADGIVSNVNIKALSSLLQCSRMTIINNNNILQEYGYIKFINTGKDYINVYIPEAETYYLPAKLGGRGYMPISLVLFNELLKCDTLNELRITLRELMNFNSSSINNLSSTVKSVNEIRRTLPKYCRPNIVKKAALKMSVFTVKLIDKGIDRLEKIRFTLPDKFNVKSDKEDRLAFYERQFADFIDELKTEIVIVNTTNDTALNLSHSELRKYKDTYEDEMFLPNLTELELTDISALALDISYCDITSSFMDAYFTYYVHGSKPKNVAGLIRHLVRIKYEQKQSEINLVV